MFSQYIFINKIYLILVIKLVCYSGWPLSALTMVWSKVGSNMQLVQFRVVDLYMYRIVPVWRRGMYPNKYKYSWFLITWTKIDLPCINFQHTFIAIFSLITWTLNHSYLLLTLSNFLFPFRSFSFIFTLNTVFSKQWALAVTCYSNLSNCNAFT